ncbi:MAG: 4-hydroxy-tetrahydrodipicolinate synthase [Devosiaceae bacterium]|nr:4-hydroxy-tetrahydrodipicolinate synthase [Devosiaceae bacterium MH13]
MPQFSGSIPALVTPFDGDAVDFVALDALVDWQISEGSTGLVPVGTTGESPTLSHDEHKQVVESVVKRAAGRVPVIAGAGSNNTLEAIDFAQHAQSVGADGILVVTPYYNKPGQEGLFQHFMAIDAAADLPTLIYNIPGRSVIDMSVDTMARLHREGRAIVGVKDATANMVRVSEQRAAMGPDFVQLSGEDATALAFNAHGGHGCISVVANVAPKLCATMQAACAAGDYAKALEIHDRLMPLHTSLFAETNPSPVKAALAMLGKCKADVRLPMVPISKQTEELVADALRFAGLLNS